MTKERVSCGPAQRARDGTLGLSRDPCVGRPRQTIWTAWANLPGRGSLRYSPRIAVRGQAAGNGGVYGGWTLTVSSDPITIHRIG
jgi:hypothetical protein